MDESDKKKELRRDRHTVSLLTDHLVITPKYRGKILTSEVAFVAEAIIRGTCAEMSIKIIDMAVDHVHIFFQYPPKYSLSYIAKKIKGRSSRYRDKNSRISGNGAISISGLPAATTVLSGRAGK